jgi:hypothetical protein
MLSDELSLSTDHVAAACTGDWPLGKFESDRRYDEQIDAALGRQLRRLVPIDKLGGHKLSGKLAESLLKRSGLTEDRLAKRVGVTRDRLADISALLWQHTFSEERDRRAGADANPQKRGQVTRALQAELEKALADGHD